LIVGTILPAAIYLARRSVANMLRSSHHPQGAPGPSSAAHAIVDHGVRGILILAAALLLARAWEIDIAAMAARDVLAARLVRGAFDAVIIFLVADLLWQLIRVTISRRLSAAEEEEDDGARTEEQMRRRARIRTLLPILKHVLFVTLVAISALMALSAMGVHIGPLLAGAGVVGVAVGFGAQTLVKDVIAGIFFLLDDAFRVGEYIVTGQIKGEVESFSLRSVKLRHHRGQLHTIPFGDIKEITNFSRDWVVDKFQVGVSYDTDLDKVKKVVKQVSAEIMEDPELATVIIEPLKSQGVYQMADTAIQIRLKVKTKPNEQFRVRRAAYAKIKRAFEANGIKFPVPTVAVTTLVSEAGPVPAAAHRVLELGRGGAGFS
jgi:small-conductance mechanosensitive channel